MATKVFEIEISEQLSRVEKIEAETLGDAIDKAMELYYGQKVILDAMEFLMSELHKEWDRTGATKASVLISLEEVEEVNKTLVATIMKRQEQADKAIDFKECVRLSKENYILLRLARKIKKEEDQTNKLALGLEFEVALDKEELKLFKGIFKSKVQ